MTEKNEPVSLKQFVVSRLPFLTFVLLTFAAFICLDLLLAQFFNDITGLFLLILIVGQLTLICVWGTLVEGTFWFRLPWTILLLVISWSALCFGAYLENGQIRSAEIMAVGLLWFYGFAISYVPLKIAAWLFAWRITFVSENQSVNALGRYAIRDIMLGTTILAVTLAVGRQFIPGELPKWSQIVSASGIENGEMLLVFLIFSIISLIVKLPCIWIALASRRSRVFVQSLIWILCSAGLGMLEMTLLNTVMSGPRGPNQSELFACLTLGHAAMAATMIAVLFGLRCFGYRMSRKTKLRPIA